MGSYLPPNETDFTQDINPRVDLKSIGRSITEFRNGQGMSQETLATQAGINRAYVSRIENGKVAFSIPIFLKICTALNLDPRRLLE